MSRNGNAPHAVARLVIPLFLLLVAACGRDAGTPAMGGGGGERGGNRGTAPIPVTSALVTRATVPVQLRTNGTVTAMQSVDVRAQLSTTVKTVHVREGQCVKKGERLFTLDAQTENANLGKAEAQLAKSRAELSNAERNLRRQQELFTQKFISQTALDTVQGQVDSWRAQVAADAAAVDAARVARGYADIVAPISGRTGAVAVYPGTLVQPSGAALVSIAQIDPIQVSFTLPERELGALKKAMTEQAPEVTVSVDEKSAAVGRRGRLSFIDNAIDSVTGTVRAKATFANAEAEASSAPGGVLWPGMFVKVTLAARTLKEVLTVPVQAVQTGPEKKFVYVIGADDKVADVPVTVVLVQDAIAVIDGLAEGARVVVDGAQNVRPGSQVSERQPSEGKP